MKYDQEVRDLTEQLFIVEGTVTEIHSYSFTQGLLTERLRGKYRPKLSIVEKIGDDPVFRHSYVSGSDTSELDFAIELTDKENKKHYFRANNFLGICFEISDYIKVVAIPLEDNPNYDEVLAILHTKKIIYGQVYVLNVEDKHLFIVCLIIFGQRQ